MTDQAAHNEEAMERLQPTRVVSQDLGALYPETVTYRLKKLFLGRPMVTEQLENERLWNPIALGVLAPDCISSSAYGTEEMLTQMTPWIGLAAFSLIVPLTFVILGVLLFVTISYWDVIGYYTKSGGSYVVARDNFGPRVAQIAAVALLIDYTVTVAVQCAAGTAALTSAVPSLTRWTVEITIGVVLLLIFGNLRGIKEAGSYFALPTYFYIFALASVIVIGLSKAVMGTLHAIPIPTNHALLVDGKFGTGTNGVLYGLAFISLLRAFANGGSSLTGLEAISNGVASFRKPEYKNARLTLVVMACTLGFLVLGVSILAKITHAVPYAAGTPTVVSQEVQAVLGTHGFGHVMFYVVQFGTLMILYTGGNTSFNGFPFLASFVAGDRFMPRQLTKRGHRLAFSNGILVLGAVALLLIIVFKAQVNGLVSLYAIGVFTGFTMAGAGMVKHHLTHKEDGKWLRGVIINGVSGAISLVVVAIFAIAKFQEGAWVVVIVGPVMFWGLLRMNRAYRREAAVLEATAGVAPSNKPLKNTVVVLVDNFDMATKRAIEYARGMSQKTRAVHFDIDPTVTAELQRRWAELGPNWLPLDIMICPDRRLERASLELVAEITSDRETECTVLLPRRSFNSRLARVLHDRTADSIASAVSTVPHVSATIVPFNLNDVVKVLKVEEEKEAKIEHKREKEVSTLPIDVRLAERAGNAQHISEATYRRRTRIAGKIRSVTVQSGEAASNLECTISDGTGSLLLVFQGRPSVPGIETGARLVVEGMVGSWDSSLAILNPDYEIVAGAPEDNE